MFCFKQFAVADDLCAMKVGTDGVLLGAWCAVNDSQSHILDVGTGTGLIAIMVAQRTERSCVDAIDIQGDCVAQAKGNFAGTPWGDRLNVIHSSLQDFVSSKQIDGKIQSGVYDHIISNPPYFITSLISPLASRTTARHTDSLSYTDLASGSSQLLSQRGVLSLILPVPESEKFIVEAAKFGLKLTRHTEVYPTPNSSPKRTLMEFSRLGGSPICNSITIEEGARHQYSDQYRALTSDFYLKF